MLLPGGSFRYTSARVNHAPLATLLLASTANKYTHVTRDTKGAYEWYDWSKSYIIHQSEIRKAFASMAYLFFVDKHVEGGHGTTWS